VEFREDGYAMPWRVDWGGARRVEGVLNTSLEF
jgi:hypothetical protein